MIRALSRRRLASHLTAAAIIGSLALCAEFATRAGLISTFLLPPPSAVLASIPSLFQQEQLALRLGETIGEVLAGAALGTLAGVFIGWLLHRWHPLRQAFLGWVTGLSAVPLILLYPLFLIFFGRGLAVIVVMSAISAVIPIILKTCEGLDDTRRVQIDVGRSFDLNPAQLFWRIRVPAALPAILSGIRLGVAYALVGVISTEYLTNYGGLGELITDLADRYEMAAMYGAILFVMVVSAGLLAFVEGMEKWLTRH
jgi:NitT/TauT family transport system permease protein